MTYEISRQFIKATGVIYARELNDASGVVESQREAFRRTGPERHPFLGFKTWRTDLKTSCPFVEEEDEMSE